MTAQAPSKASQPSLPPSGKTCAAGCAVVGSAGCCPGIATGASFTASASWASTSVEARDDFSNSDIVAIELMNVQGKKMMNHLEKLDLGS
jgi:hypothetical protein